MSDRLVKVGLITSTHGVRGFLKVRIFAENPLELLSSAKIFDENENQVILEPKFSKGDDALIASINNISSKEEAEELRGKYLYIKRSDLPPLSGDEFYHEDLIGLNVVYEDGYIAGVVKSVSNFGASDLLEIESDSSNFFYPFHKNFVIDVNMKDCIITVKKLEDLQ